MKNYILYNPLSGTGTAKSEADALALAYETTETINVTEINVVELVSSLSEDDKIILCGGDGTINRFANDLYDTEIKCGVLYYPAGTGNDFLRDINETKSDKPIDIKKYIKNLPEVTVNGKSYRFINGVGYGIDGYCCEEGDRLRTIPGKKVDYTAIAIKGLLGKFKPKNAKVTVDGVEREYKKVWLAPTMHGRYYGGGMIATPNQNRENSEDLSLMVWHGSGKLKTLMAFPSIFKGEHVKKTKYIEIIRGKEIKVEFDKPCALQVDGETILDVTSYSAHSNVTANINA